MQKVIRVWDKTEEVLVVILIGIASYLTFQEVILRYVFNTGWSGSYEITVMSLIWCTFIGASLGIKENIHIGVDVLVVKFGPKTQRIIISVSIALCFLFGIIVAVKGFEFAKFISSRHLLSRLRACRARSESRIPPSTLTSAPFTEMGTPCPSPGSRLSCAWKTPGWRSSTRSPVRSTPAGSPHLGTLTCAA